MTITSPHPYDRHISPVLLTITSPPLKEVRELAQRSMCKGGMFIIDSSTNWQIDSSTHRQIDKSPNRQIT